MHKAELSVFAKRAAAETPLFLSLIFPMTTIEVVEKRERERERTRSAVCRIPIDLASLPLFPRSFRRPAGGKKGPATGQDRMGKSMEIKRRGTRKERKADLFDSPVRVRIKLLLQESNSI